jgi:hypothetical protein
LQGTKSLAQLETSFESENANETHHDWASVLNQCTHLLDTETVRSNPDQKSIQKSCHPDTTEREHGSPTQLEQQHVQQQSDTKWEPARERMRQNGVSFVSDSDAGLFHHLFGSVGHEHCESSARQQALQLLDSHVNIFFTVAFCVGELIFAQAS